MAEDLTAFLQRLERHALTRSVAPDVAGKRDDGGEHPATSSLPRHVHASGEKRLPDKETKRDGKRDRAVTLPAEQPTSPCLLCGTTAWQWAPDWPEPERGAWLCRTCAARPTPTLADVYATLSDEERRRLAAEAAAGDDLARDLLNALEIDEEEEDA